MSNKIQELIDAEMPNWQLPTESTFEWDVDDVERFTKIVATKVVKHCLQILADKGNYEGGAVESFEAIVKQFGLDPTITYDSYYYEHFNP